MPADEGREEFRQALARFEEEVYSLDGFSVPKASGLEESENSEESENGAFVLLGASFEIAKLESANRGEIRRLSHLRATEWKEEDRDWATSFLADHSEILEQASAASNRSGSSFGLDIEKGLSMEIPNLLDILAVSDLGLIEIQSALAAGDIAKARHGIGVQLALARIVGGEKPLIFTLVSLAMERNAYAGVQAIVEDPKVLGNELRPLIPMLEAPDRLATLALGMAGETWILTRLESGLEERPEAFREMNEAEFRSHLSNTAAHYLDTYRWAVAQKKTRHAEASSEAPPPRPATSLGGQDSLVVEYSTVVGRLIATDAARALAHAAVQLRLDGYRQPPEGSRLSVDLRPFGPQTAVFARAKDLAGPVILAIPELSELLDRLQYQGPSRRDSLYRWLLPITSPPSP